MNLIKTYQYSAETHLEAVEALETMVGITDNYIEKNPNTHYTAIINADEDDAIKVSVTLYEGSNLNGSEEITTQA